MLLHWDGLRTLPLDRVTEGKGLPVATIALPSVQAYADNDWFEGRKLRNEFIAVVRYDAKGKECLHTEYVHHCLHI